MWRFLILMVALVLPGPAVADVADAAFRNGLTAFNEGIYARAEAAWSPLAEAGDARAQTGLGFIYYSGRGAARDSARAAEFFQRTAGQGEPTAQLFLAQMYFKSDGVPMNATLALMWVELGQGPTGCRCRKVLHRSGNRHTHMTVVKPEELVVAIRIPSKWSGAKFYFEKVADRSTWDFALVNVASALKVTNGTIDAARVACGGVSCTPRLIQVAEDVVNGSQQNEETAELAGKTATHGARRVNYNQFKIPMMENLVKRAIRDAV
jgi:TPR repeat protein